MHAVLLRILSTTGGVPGAVALLAGAAAGLMSWGYLLWLKARQPDGPCRGSARSSDPAVDVIVAVHNEADQIAGKLSNLQGLRYSADRLRFWIVDGASTDGTFEIAARCTENDPRVHILTERPDKTAQLNAALARCTAPWVLITDADARLHPATLTTLLDTAGSDERIGAVGTTVQPAESCHWLERAHWRISNRVRRLESLAGCASLVTAPCYLVRRNIIESLPEDVVADDIYTAMAAALRGWRVCFADMPVTELRSPRSLPELFRHKLRKTLAYLREIYRFLPALRGMPPPARAVFAWRSAQLVLLPWTAAIAIGAILLSASTALIAAVAASGIGLVAALLVGTEAGARGPRAALSGLALALLLLAVCMTAFVIYPFKPRSACFPKVGVERREGPGHEDP